MASADANAFTVVYDDGGEMPGTQELRSLLEKGPDDVKIDTLRRIIVSTLNGNAQPALLMPIIQFVLPSKNKALKKLLHFYWEVCPKYDDSGKLKQEMILVVNAIRNDLQHPNEYIRGATLRFLQKLRDQELLEPLVPTCRACLEHRHSFVRKNAVLAIYTIYRTFEHLIPDAPELVHTFLAAESDATCKRNAFIFLTNCAPNRAREWLTQTALDGIASVDELLQVAVIDFVRVDVARPDSASVRRKYVQAISELLGAGSTSVKYEAAMSLTALTHAPVAVKAAAQALVDVMAKESDNNVKMIVLDRIDTLRRKHEGVIDGLVMDILRAVTAPDIEVRRRAVGIALTMVSTRNAEEVVSFLSKQLVKTLDTDYEKSIEYRQLLIQSTHALAVRFGDIVSSSSTISALMSFLADSSASSSQASASAAASDAIAFVREVVQKFPNMRSTVLSKLLEALPTVRSGKVFRGALWIVGEYAATTDEIRAVFNRVRSVLGEVPILASEQRAAEENGGSVEDDAAKGISMKTKVLADGTYVTEGVYSSGTSNKPDLGGKPPLRALLLGGDFYTGAVLASTLSKLVLRHRQLAGVADRAHNALRAEAMLIMTSIVRLGQSTIVSLPIDEDAAERIVQCIQTLALSPDSPPSSIDTIFLQDTKKAYATMVAAEEKKAAEKRAQEAKRDAVQVDDLLSFRQFAKKATGDVVESIEEDLGRATGAGEVQKEDTISNLSRVVQLTGFSDPVYAEAIVKVNGFDILLDVLIVNQTPQTLQNLCIEFATLGDLKLVERLGTQTLGPHAFHSVKATIKVSSTETGVVFGNIIWENGPGTSETCVILNDIHVDIMDYIKPAKCSETQFRSMWTEFEWENRVNVVTNIMDLRTYLSHIMRCTNMACLTPDAALGGECDFLSANLYARSLFGEDALANLSIERVPHPETGEIQVTGYVRIRSKTQGIALSLGDKITLAQKDVPASTVH
ncbi:coatomer beta subunit [Auriculariales sp. MPI-PUGE-AT-0066]|nr:coatomer beta subunit [Auriculariales sp. MPI-PUGE-AT-0066]